MLKERAKALLDIIGDKAASARYVSCLHCAMQCVCTVYAMCIHCTWSWLCDGASWFSEGAKVGSVRVPGWLIEGANVGLVRVPELAQ